MAIPSLAVSAGAESPVRAAIMKRCCRRNSIRVGGSIPLDIPLWLNPLSIVVSAGSIPDQQWGTKSCQYQECFPHCPVLFKCSSPFKSTSPLLYSIGWNYSGDLFPIQSHWLFPHLCSFISCVLFFPFHALCNITFYTVFMFESEYCSLFTINNLKKKPIYLLLHLNCSLFSSVRVFW